MNRPLMNRTLLILVAGAPLWQACGSQLAVSGEEAASLSGNMALWKRNLRSVLTVCGAPRRGLTNTVT